MKKYYVAFLVLAVLSLGLVGYVATQGIIGRQDKQVEEQARDIAEKLNGYISDKQTIPETLGDAGVKDAPDAIEYKKVSNQQYEFCVTYRAASGYSVTNVSSLATGAALTRLSADYGNTDYIPSNLYISPEHIKGRNCQKVEPYISSKGSSISEYCDPSHEYYDYYRSYCDSESSSLFEG